MPNLEVTRENWERALSTRLRRIENQTEKSGRTGTLPELEAAEKDMARATGRLSRARIAHAVATAEAKDYADALTALGGTPVMPEGFAVYVNPEAATDLESAPVVAETEHPADGVDAQGNFTDPDRDGVAVDDEAEDSEPDLRQPRSGGRFARKG